MPVPHLMTAGTAMLAALAMIAPVIAPAGSDAASRCSIMPFSGGRGSQETLLLGSASTDTVLAGAGEVTTSGESGHVGRGVSGPIFGQVINVARYAGSDSVMLERAFEESGNARVIIVPWDYDASCRPTRWDAGAAWVPVAEPGVFTVRLRPDSLWAGGVPVFDAFMANFEPYPLGSFYRRGYLGTDSLRTTTSLAPAEYFDLLRAVPDNEELQAAPDVAWSTILQWQAAHPELAARYPATRMIDMIGRRIGFTKARQALRTIEPIVAGTWRFTWSMDDGRPRVFFARTRPRATTDWHDPARGRVAVDPAQTPPRAEGYHVLASVASSVDSLPADCEGERDIRRESYIAALEPPTGEERREWSGLLDMRLVEKQFPDDSAVRVFARQFSVQSGRHYREGVRFAPARYTLDDDGVLRVEQTVRLDDGRSAVLEGVRVSTDVIACDW